MIECNSIGAHNIYPNLNDRQQFRLNESNDVKDYFIAEIKEIELVSRKLSKYIERELMSKRLSKYIASFDYFVKYLIVLSATGGSISIASFVTVIGEPAGIASASFSFAFSMSAEIIKRLLKATRNKKKKHNIVVMLTRSKLNSIENKTSEALINNETGYGDLPTIINEKKVIEN